MIAAGKKVKLSWIDEQDYEELYLLKYGEANPEWKKWDAPYFHLERKTFEVYKRKMAEKPAGMEAKITADMQLIGTVAYYWEYEPSNWLEAGIVIYHPDFWSGGYGSEALALWIEHLFTSMPIPRVGITTWSGNERMMRTAAKQGMKLEGRMRKCRLYNGEYYDSIRMGILREEWDVRKSRSLP
ncbi:GNAT family N-acetyltransferase [Metabacillus sp. KIGAM252]|uniref:GNAT family N-acetyltransferase n=1 Tax=Metabacillus flavus TaxID=2823519 RepID=A0ABS5LCM5_9BACI|nr:GNAT family protein [Metabacillus flavus]MBS2968333.1 GNAT family N-acetyltransferase [Metabacillus flavus]